VLNRLDFLKRTAGALAALVAAPFLPEPEPVVTGFAGVAESFAAYDGGPRYLITAADVYVSDFGTLSVIPNRFQRNHDEWVLA
jgi:hypothetical protein